MILILIAIIVALLSYIYLIKPYSYWRNKGVPQTNPTYVIGDNWKNVTRKVPVTKIFRDVYNEAKDNRSSDTSKTIRRYYGFYQLLIPSLMVKDLDLIKRITIKDFDYFQDHFQIVPDDIDPLWSRNLLSLRDERWRDMRTTLSPSFTSSKMRVIFGLISECAESFNDYFTNLKDDQLKSLEMKDLFTRFANDVIASVAFGVKCDSLRHRDNEFYRMGKEATDFTSTKSYRLLILLLSSRLSKILGVKVYSNAVATFFRGLVKKTIEYRKKNGITRPDMLHQLMEASNDQDKQEEVVKNDITGKNGNVHEAPKHAKYELSNDITAQGLIFFFAGFDSVTSLMSYMAYQLALNTDIQERLRNEIDDTNLNCDDSVTYEALLKMEYLDVVVSECLRLWPVFIGTDRVVTKPYTIEPAAPGEKPLHLDKGTMITIPTHSIHHDAKYYPDPEKFDPERFNNENKANIKQYAYIPFGAGPRLCIGSRFALLEIKAVFFHLLSSFEIIPCEKTEIPLALSKSSFNMDADNGFWVALRRR